MKADYDVLELMHEARHSCIALGSVQLVLLVVRLRANSISDVESTARQGRTYEVGKFDQVPTHRGSDHVRSVMAEEVGHRHRSVISADRTASFMSASTTIDE